MGRFVKIATLLAVYLAWICGTAFIALSCNAKKHTLCTHCCECHHEGCDKAHVETPHSCNHDHSNTVILYDSTKKNGFNIEPIVLCIAAQIENLLSIEDVPSIRQPRHYERDIPIRPLHITARRGMRAPPVVA